MHAPAHAHIAHEEGTEGLRVLRSLLARAGADGAHIRRSAAKFDALTVSGVSTDCAQLAKAL